MNAQYYSHRRWIPLLTVLWFGIALARAAESDLAARISEARIFPQPLLWIGSNAPTHADCAALWAELQPEGRTNQQTRQIDRLEKFVAKNPDGYWTPSVRANLAVYYRKSGHYSLALKHWEAAWDVVKEYEFGPGRKVRDYVLSQWSGLLSSLGRVDKLRELHAANGGRTLCDLDWERRFKASEVTLRIMEHEPGISYRCGTFALTAIGNAMGKRFDANALRDIPSPQTGFSFAQLADLAKQYNFDLVPAHRISRTELVVPSIVHWRQNHYAAIVAKKDNYYQVTDPTFGGAKWLSAEAINDEASGYFFVPRTAKPSGWEDLNSSELEQIFGKGEGDGPTPPPVPPCNAPPDSCCRPPGAPGGGGGGGGAHGGCEFCLPAGGQLWGNDGGEAAGGGMMLGMPTWSVLEPYISVQLQDVPVSYQPSRGSPFAVKMYYSEHEEKPTNYFGFGPQWCSGLLSYVHLVNNFNDSMIDFPYWSATVFGLGGGQLNFAYVSNSIDPTTLTSFERVFSTNQDDQRFVSNVVVHYPNGASAIYGLYWLVANNPTTVDFFLTQYVDSHGNTMTFNYSTNSSTVLLTNVLDTDGKTNKVVYDGSWTTRIAEIDTPYGTKVTFAYNADGVLTNIVDALGMTNGFLYQLTSGYYIITNLATPYGNTTFAYTTPEDLLYGPGTSGVNRAVVITEPTGAKHMYMFRDRSLDFIANIYNDAPDYLPFDPSTASLASLSNFRMNFRNSFYWGPRQYAALSTTNVTGLSTNDYLLARLRNWLHAQWPCEDCDGMGTSGTLQLERDFSPAVGVAGQKTWYGYAGKANGGDWESTTNNLPVYIAQRLPDGGTRYTYKEYNHKGHVTLEGTTNIINGVSYSQKTRKFTYAADGIDLLFVTNYSGIREASYSYDSHHHRLTETNAVGDVTFYTYDTDEHMTGGHTAAGLTTTNTYDASGYLDTTIDLEINRTNKFTYTNGLVFSHINERGLATTNRWDALNRLISVTYPDGTYTSNRYDKLDLFATRDRLGNWTYFAYDASRRRTAITNALGYVTTFAYCNCGSLDSISDALANVTHFYYDGAGRRTATVLPDGRWTTNNYNLLGQITNLLDSAGGSTTNWYNNQGMLMAVSNAFGRVRSSAFDIEDRLTNQVSAEGVSISMTYDDLGRMVRRGYSDGTAELFKYSARGLVAQTNQLSKVTGFAYDEAGRKTAETNANGDVTQFTYNAAGDLHTLTNEKGAVTTWNYDSFGLATNKLDPSAVEIFVYRYDADRRLTNRWTPEKGNTYYTYDVVGNLTNVDYPSSHDLAFQYDALNRMTKMVDAVGTTTFGYTSAGALAFEDGPWAANRVSYSYTLGQLTGLAVDHFFETDWQQSYSYDSARRLKTTTSPAGTFTYTYAGAGRLWTNLVLGNGASIVNAYDDLARLTATRLKNSGGTELNSHTYLYDEAGRRTNTVRVDGSYVRYKYDDIGQVKVAQGYETGGTARLQEQLGYAYDAAGNLNYRTNNALVQTFSVDNNNQLYNATYSGTLTVAGTTTSAATNVTVNGVTASRYGDNTFAADGFSFSDDPGDTNTFTAVARDSYGRSASNTVSTALPATAVFYYDSNGNLLSDGKRHFTYDDENQLTTVVVTNSTKSEFTYDGKMRRRIRKEYVWQNSAWKQTDEIHYVYDGNLVVEERDGNNVTLLNFTRGNDLSGTRQKAGGIGGLLARTDNLQSGSRVHACFHADGNGNVTILMDSLQLVAAKYLYDAFGNCLYAIGPLAEANLYRFSSKEWHQPAGLSHYLRRDYDPGFQRWLNCDPILQGAKNTAAFGPNSYSFVQNGPTMNIDPLGLTLYVCTRPTEDWYVPGNHAYFWDDNPETPPSMRSCAMRASSGNNQPGPHTGHDGQPEQGPINGDFSSITDPNVHCRPVSGTGSQDTVDKVMDCCEQTSSTGVWFPGVNDCHSKIKNCLKEYGLEDPGHPRLPPISPPAQYPRHK